MNDTEKIQIQRINDRLQQAVLLVNYLERTHLAAIDDLRQLTQALRLVTVGLHSLPASGGEERE